MGHQRTGRRFQDVDEIYIFRVAEGKLAGAFGVEDNMRRMRQLGLSPYAAPRRAARQPRSDAAPARQASARPPAAD